MSFPLNAGSAGADAAIPPPPPLPSITEPRLPAREVPSPELAVPSGQERGGSHKYAFPKFDATQWRNATPAVDVSMATDASIQIVSDTRAAGGTPAVFTIERSNDGSNFVSFIGPTEAAVTMAAGQMTARLDVRGIGFLRVAVTTADSVSPCLCSIIIVVQSVS